MVYNNLLDMVGNTPVVHFSSCIDDHVTFFIKLEGCNPTGSVKDRAALAIIRDKINKRELISGKTILDASSGSFACSIAMFGNILGFPVKVVTGSKMTEDKTAFIEYFNAERISHGNFTIEGNRYCSEILLRDAPERFCFLDQLHNWETANTHYVTTGSEILRDLPDISAVAFSLGSGGTLNGVSRYIRENSPETQIVAVTAAAGAKIPGTGAFVDGDYITPFIADSKAKGHFDYTATVDLDKAIQRVKELRQQGFYVGIQTGAVYQGMVDAIKDLSIRGKVLIISGDAGWKNMDKLLQLVNNSRLV